jgi:pimeloyl-ACP methyl ester carboxylesterase
VTTYVLVHGAWHGGWCWRNLTRAMAAPAVKIFTPTLTGLGERAHLASRDVGLATHVEDILQVLTYEDLREVILVGHSYAGVVVTAVADRVPQRLARLVYLDAVVPKSGQSLFDCASSEFRELIDDDVRTAGEGWRIPVPRPEMLGLVRNGDINWVMPKLVAHPYRTFREPVDLRASAGAVVQRAYINCINERPRGGPRTPQAEGIGEYHELSTWHDAMVTAPEDLAKLLMAMA